MTDVFISYSRKDAEFSQKVFNVLTAEDKTTWIDWDKIPITSDWWQEIQEGIEVSESFIFIISPDSLSSPVCTLEVAHARQYQKHIIPVMYIQPEVKNAFASLAVHNIEHNLEDMLDGRDLLVLARDNWIYLSKLNWVLFKQSNDFDISMQNLITATQNDIAHIKYHTRLLVRAREWEQSQEDTGYLLAGDALREAENWLKFSIDGDPQPSQLHKHYIHSCIEEENEKRFLKEQQQERELFLVKRSRNLWRYLLGMIVIAVIIIISIGGLIVRNIVAEERFNYAITASLEDEALTALQLATLLGLDVNSRLKQELSGLLDPLLSDYDDEALHLANLYSQHFPSNAKSLSVSLTSDIREEVAQGRVTQVTRLSNVLVILDPDTAGSFLDELHNQSVNYYMDTNIKEARAALEAIRVFETSISDVRSLEAQSASRQLLGSAIELDTELTKLQQAADAYREAIMLDPTNMEAYYSLASLLLVEFSDEPDSVSEGIRFAQIAIDLYEAEVGQTCELTKEVNDSWYCFLLFTTESGLRFVRGDEPRIIRALLDRAISIAEKHNGFSVFQSTAEAYYYQSKLDEPNTNIDTLCKIIIEHDRSNLRHREWVVYANTMLDGELCLPS